MPKQRPASAIARQDAILRIIKKHPVANQQQLQSHLKKAGYQVTQATLSRDLDAIGARKQSRGASTRYVAPQTARASASLSSTGNSNTTSRQTGKSSAAQRAKAAPWGALLIEVDHAGYLVVAMTPPGGAQLLAAEGDRFDRGDVLGTVAGDDSVLIVTRSPASAKKFAKEMVSLAGRR
jgi:transcriptional regulator of arginine metabolism